ncbi:MAG: PA0069 family radical SAM protein [Acidiferrobacterales bacterium]
MPKLSDAGGPNPRGLREHKGRGSLSNRAGRYEGLTHEAIDDGWGAVDEATTPLRTTATEDKTRSVITRNDSPDVPFEQSINPYRGCEHGCIYCFARPTHAYLGLSPGLDFESRLFFKPDAAQLLEREFRNPRYRCQPITLGTNTDPYQPLERKLCITRQLLKVLAAHRHPVSIVTKSALVERDLDILAPMAEKRLANVTISITTLDRQLARRMEPRAAAPERRLQTLRTVGDAGIPTGVLVAPVIPGLTDNDLESIVTACAAVGVCFAGYVLLRLPLEVRDLFKEWLTKHYPMRATHVMSLIRQTRAGRENDPRFGARKTGTGHYANMISHRFRLICKQLYLNKDVIILDTSQFMLPRVTTVQPGLFDD